MTNQHGSSQVLNRNDVKTRGFRVIHEDIVIETVTVGPGELLQIAMRNN